MTIEPIKAFPKDTPVFFKISPDAGHPKCLCSVCFEPIGEDEFPLRMYRQSDNTEARFCEKCQKEYWGMEHFPDLDPHDYSDEVP